jgi:hypothetical protein
MASLDNLEPKPDIQSTDEPSTNQPNKQDKPKKKKKMQARAPPSNNDKRKTR